MEYRPEIDGLRAIAVLSVMLFHAGIKALPGGYLGVDIFFVISGYLITSIISTEMEGGRFTFAAFYERRARRILPALFVVVLVCTPLVFVLMLPREVLEFSKSVIAVCAFVSNVFFWSQSGYFDRIAELKPLLHTWSLGVEEQFYLFFPILLMGALKFGRKWAGVLLAAIAVVSISYAQWGPQSKEATFYLIPSRLWELLMGAILALLPMTKWRAQLSNAALDTLVLLGIGLIAFGLFERGGFKYPGFRALTPVAGAWLVIAFATTRTATGRVLGSRIPVAIGLVSYSAYLWHQPVLVFGRLSGFDRPGLVVALALTAISLILAVLTYRFVEQPARDRKWLTRPALIATCSFGIFALAGTSVAAIATNGFEKQGIYFSGDDTRRLYQLLMRDTGGELTRDMGADGNCIFWMTQLEPAAWGRLVECSKKFGPGTVVIGDSHAMNIYNALFRSNYGKFVVGLVNPGCRPWDNTRRECPYIGFGEFMEAHRQTVGTVILHFAGSHLVLDENDQEEPSDVLKFGGKYHFSDNAISQTIGYLQAMSGMTRTVWLGPFVEPRLNFADFEGMKKVAREGYPINPVTVDIFLALERHLRGTIDLQRRTFDYVSFFDIVKPDAMNLLSGDCLMYRDFDHLSVCGETVVGKDLKVRLSRYASPER